MSTTKTILLDASMMRESSCILRIHRKLLQGYTLPSLSSDIVFGSGFHTYAKVNDETQDMMKGVVAGIDYYNKTPKFFKKNKAHLTSEYLMDVCMQHNEVYKHDAYDIVKSKDGKPYVETRIAYPYYITPERDIEILLCGTVDRIIYNRIAGFYAIEDYKTTHAWDINGYFNQYQLSTQLRMYKLLLTLYGKLFPGSVIDTATSKPLACIINGIFLKIDQSVKFERSQEFWFSDSDMVNFERGLKIFILERLIPSIREPSKYLYKEGIVNSSCSREFGMCDFAESCSKDTEEEMNSVLNENFIKSQYNPLTHGELAV